MQSFLGTSSSSSIGARRNIFWVPQRKSEGYNQTILSPAEAAEKARITIMQSATELKELPIAVAFETWLEEKALRNRDTTINCYRDYLKPVAVFMSAQTVRTLTDIHIGHFLEYQRRHKGRYHPASVNHHLNTLAQILRRAGLWTPIREHYHPLPLPEVDPPKVMSETEEDRFFEFAAKRDSGWDMAYWVASLTNNTTASGKELRMLQRASIHMDHEPPYFHVPKNMKTPRRQRNIPMNERAIAIMERVLIESAKRGSTRDEHFVFPKRLKRGLFDPNQPATESWLRSQWKKLVDAALEAKVISFRIKPHNLRHQAITKLLDYGVPIETVRQIAGHGVDSLVTRHYHHARMETMAKAVTAIDPGKRRPDYVPANRNSKGERA